jgi:hypothetical protein
MVGAYPRFPVGGARVMGPPWWHGRRYPPAQRAKGVPATGNRRETLVPKSSNHTGGKVPRSGIYKPATGGKEIAVSQGEKFPPSKGKGTSYKPVRPTK